MNFFDSTLVGENGNLFVDTGDFRILVPEDMKSTFNDFISKEVVLGIRPEHIHGAAYALPNINAANIKANVEVIELLGHELHLFLNSGKNNFVSIVDTRMSPSVGSEVDLVIDADQMHLFDKDSELAIR
jgi:multiple sugar transport system ATP-binding protein